MASCLYFILTAGKSQHRASARQQQDLLNCFERSLGPRVKSGWESKRCRQHAWGVFFVFVLFFTWFS